MIFKIYLVSCLTHPVSQSREVHGSRLYAIGQQKNTVSPYTYSLNDRVALIYASPFRDDN